ncbi:MAG: glutamate--tRNA ligase family protein [Gemmatimonadaceae bacterium]|jgi:glutamyl/glutaminyl-tRNA synthetase|nr:glutamate--tRNA ligase family protein [Gemmatimonadaceae bacterium]
MLDDRLTRTLRPGFRTRFAPAPTGYLHLGHAVNAVWVWSIARAFGGTVLLRVEDHDTTRCRPEYEAGLLDDLDWLGLVPDEGSTASYRPSGPHVLRQRDRSATYAAALTRLDAAGLLYPCRCSRADISALQPHAIDEEPRYPGTCRTLALDAATHPARRVRLAREEVCFDDLVHGAQRQVPAEQCGDLLVRNRRGEWTYQFAVVVDDLEQRIDLIIRGTDLLASTGRQQLLAQALGAERLPRTLHHDLVRHPDGTKLSKSRGDAGLRELRAAGWSAARVLGHAAWRAGLQPEDRPLAAEALPTLWAR